MQAITTMDAAEKINTLHRSIIGSVRKTLSEAIEAGRLLSDIKVDLKHGEFTDWIERNLDFDVRTAQRYMKAYIHRDKLKSDNVSFLSDAYKLLESKTEPTSRSTSIRIYLKTVEAFEHAITTLEHAPEYPYDEISQAFDNLEKFLDSIKRESESMGCQVTPYPMFKMPDANISPEEFKALMSRLARFHQHIKTVMELLIELNILHKERTGKAIMPGREWLRSA